MWVNYGTQWWQLAGSPSVHNKICLDDNLIYNTYGGEALAEETFKAGYVAVIGRPNVGKSTLMNAFLGQKVAAVSPRPQTTRRRQLGILTLPQAQIIFIDTPGIHKPVDKMGNYMNEVALSTLQDADLLLWLVSADEPPSDEDRLVASRLNQLKSLPPVILALNKTDLLTAKQLAQRRNQFQELLPKAELMAISATAKLHLNELQAGHHCPPARRTTLFRCRTGHRPVRARDRRRIDPRGGADDLARRGAAFRGGAAGRIQGS